MFNIGGILKKKGGLSDEPKDYEALGIEKGKVEAWENGLRSNCRGNGYEWWNVEIWSENDVVLNIVFKTTYRRNLKGEECPTAVIDIVYPDGKNDRRIITEGINMNLRASREECNVAVGKSRLKHSHGDYTINFESAGLDCSVKLISEVEPWRPGSGIWRCGDKYRGWILAQPLAYAYGSINIDGMRYRINGRAYQAHAWGNISHFDLYKSWRGGSFKIDRYNIHLEDFIVRRKYGGGDFTVIMIAEDDKIFEGNQKDIKITRKKKRSAGSGNNLHESILVEFNAHNGDYYKLELKEAKEIRCAKGLKLKNSKESKTYVRIKGRGILTAKENGVTKQYKKELEWVELLY